MRYINRIKPENIKSFTDHTNCHLYEAAALFGYNITDKPKTHPKIEKEE